MTENQHLHEPETKQWHTEHLLGVDVKLAHKPYKTQRVMMAKIIKSLKSGQNCIIESPTGTGKTMALLCATLAWLEKSKSLGRPFLAYGIDPLSTDEEGVIGTCGEDDHKTTIPMPPNKKLRSTLNATALDENSNMVTQNQSLQQADYLLAANPGEALGYSAQNTIDISTRQTSNQKHLSALTYESVDVGKKIDTQLPKIYFVTRTHGQITQVINELNANFYCKCVKVCTLASRERSCINELISTSDTIKETCMNLVANHKKLLKYNQSGLQNNEIQTRTCKFYSDISTLRRKYLQMVEKFSERAWDIEDAKQYGRQCTMCPYYGTRLIQSFADLTLCPYNYIFDTNVRANTNINLSGSILIFDEAHNIEDMCRDCASFRVTTEQLRSIIRALSNETNFVKQGDITGFRDGLKFFHNVVINLLNYIEGVHTNSIDSKKEFPKNNILGAVEIGALLMQIGLDTNHLSEAKHHIDIIQQITYLTDQLVNDESTDVGNIQMNNTVQKRAAGRKVKNQPNNSHNNTMTRMKTSDATSNNIRNITNAVNNGRINSDMTKILLDLVHCADLIYYPTGSNVKDYRMVITEDITSCEWRPASGQAATSLHDFGIVASKRVRTLDLMCMSPRVLFNQIERSAWSVIAASGTLAPVDVFCKEMGCKFDNIFQGMHVINERQFNLSIIARGPSGLELNGSYIHSDTDKYRQEVGLVVVDVCRKISNGILCFVTSYEKMDRLMEIWNANGTINLITNDGKQIFKETRSMSDRAFDCLLLKYRSTALSTGAILFAVHRGRASEGVDFPDDLARAVISIGIPFAALTDNKIKLKKQFNDECIALGSTATASGTDWYIGQAFRSLFQAVGRCIRHKRDWGAMVIVDSRMSQANLVDKIPRWLKSRFTEQNEVCRMLPYDVVIERLCASNSDQG